MKTTFFLILFVSASLTSFSQEITGEWNGALKAQAIQLRLVLNITKTDTGYSATMDSPDQGAKGISITSISFENSKLKFAVASARIEYEGTLGKDSIIVGAFKQAGKLMPLM